MGLTVNRLAFSLTPNSTMETSGAKRKIEQDSENVTLLRKNLVNPIQWTLKCEW